MSTNESKYNRDEVENEENGHCNRFEEESATKAKGQFEELRTSNDSKESKENRAEYLDRSTC